MTYSNTMPAVIEELFESRVEYRVVNREIEIERTHDRDKAIAVLGIWGRLFGTEHVHIERRSASPWRRIVERKTEA